MNVVVTRQLAIAGTVRLDDEIVDAVAPRAGGLPVGDILTATLALSMAR